MPDTFKVGEAPWETASAPSSFPVGQAPWETPVSKGTGESTAQSVITGAEKYLVESLGGLGDIGGFIANQTAGRVINAVKGNGFTPTQTDPSILTQAGSPELKTQNKSELVGKFLGFGLDLAAPIPKIGEAIAAKRALNAGLTNDLPKIAELISPKLTAKEVRLAQSQGRIVPGKLPTIFRSGTPDQVLTSDKVAEAAFSIRKNIPGASKLSEPDLYTALEARTMDMAKKLKPEMQAVKVKPETLQHIDSEWSSLKKLQLEAADATEEANVLKQQIQFESRLNKIKKEGVNYDDLWQERIAYDDSIPETVKKANQLSDSRLLQKKEIWLQNRDILNKVITNAENDLGDKVFKEFKDMSNMYQAKTNLLSKATVSLKKEQSKLVQWIKDHPYISGLVAGSVGSVVGKSVLNGAMNTLEGL